MENTVRFLGTGAADQPWKEIHQDSRVRGSTSSLINGKILVDCGPTTWQDLEHWNVDLSQVETLIFTHGHSDHCNRENVVRLITAVPKLQIYSSEALAASLKASGISAERIHTVVPKQKFTAAGLEVLTLAANHASVLPPECPEGEVPMHYLFRDGASGRTLFYALDGAWLLRPTFLALLDYHLDTIIWDCTMGGTGDFRIFEHNSLEMLDLMLQTLGRLKITNADTNVWLDHLAWTLWPQERDEAAALAGSHRYRLAQDGNTISW